jgi:hypothetical protein
MKAIRTFLTAALLLGALATHAQQVERILLPIAFPGEIHGSFGTVWASEVLLFNDAETVLTVDGQTLNPRASININPPLSQVLPSLGAFIYVSKNEVERARFTSLLTDRSRAEENVGTEIPVVRERDYSNRIVLPRVPLRGDFRVALRIYGSSSAPMEARIRMYRLDRLDPFVDIRVDLNGVININPEPFPRYPSFFHIFELVKQFPVLEAAASVRIEIDAVHPDETLWAFASITNNTTQLVTTISPQ